MTYQKRGTVVAEQYNPGQQKFKTFCVLGYQDTERMKTSPATIVANYQSESEARAIYPGDYLVFSAVGKASVMQREVFEGLYERFEMPINNSPLTQLSLSGEALAERVRRELKLAAKGV